MEAPQSVPREQREAFLTEKREARTSLSCLLGGKPTIRSPPRKNDGLLVCAGLLVFFHSHAHCSGLEFVGVCWRLLVVLGSLALGQNGGKNQRLEAQPGKNEDLLRPGIYLLPGTRYTPTVVYTPTLLIFRPKPVCRLWCWSW